MEMNWRKGGKEENWNKEEGIHKNKEEGIRKKEQKTEDEKRKEERKKGKHKGGRRATHKHTNLNITTTSTIALKKGP